jgi:hypothetical protein
MKINRSETRPPSGLGNTAGALPASKSGGGTGPEALPLAADRVQLSNLSASLTAATGDSAAHLEKLSALAAVALSGGYQVDAGVVSDSIIRHSLQFGGAKYL